jgi:hypothetical protein
MSDATPVPSSSQAPLTYDQAGVNYDLIDPLKVAAQRAAAQTGGHLGTHGFSEVLASRGESAYVVDVGPMYLASIVECLGTKTLVADEMATLTGKSYYDGIAQDTIAMAVNDLITVGATPLVVQAYWAAGGSDWFGDKVRANALVAGWKKACDVCKVAWGGGETPALAGIVADGRVDLAASCTGIISPKSRLSVGDQLGAGDAIVFLAASGIHANGLSLARKLAERLPQGYLTDIGNGQTYGEALLAQAAAAPQDADLPHHPGAAQDTHFGFHAAAMRPGRPRGLRHAQHGRRFCAVCGRRPGRAGGGHLQGTWHRGLGGRPRGSRPQAGGDRAPGRDLRRRRAATALSQVKEIWLNSLANLPKS